MANDDLRNRAGPDVKSLESRYIVEVAPSDPTGKVTFSVNTLLKVQRPRVSYWSSERDLIADKDTYAVQLAGKLDTLAHEEAVRVRNELEKVR
jgi:hypothetical protein